MPEGTKDASVLIATSWQALGRARDGSESTILCNCTVVLIFAAFYIEANLNHIIEELGKTKDVEQFFNTKFTGLQNKLGWFYNSFVARSVAINRKQLFDKGIKSKLKKKFPGFNKIYNFRNEISHGHINRDIAKITETEILRKQAKDIVDQLFKIITKAGYPIKRNITYEIAIADDI